MAGTELGNADEARLILVTSLISVILFHREPDMGLIIHLNKYTTHRHGSSCVQAYFPWFLSVYLNFPHYIGLFKK